MKKKSVEKSKSSRPAAVPQEDGNVVDNAEVIAHAEVEAAQRLEAARARLSTLRRPIGIRFRKDADGSAPHPQS